MYLKLFIATMHYVGALRIYRLRLNMAYAYILTEIPDLFSRLEKLKFGEYVHKDKTYNFSNSVLTKLIKV